jgi:hypothetical protein
MPTGRAFGYRACVQDRVRRGVRFLTVVALWGATATARAADPPGRLIGGSSTCPSPAAVRTEIELLVPREHLNARLRASGGSGPLVEITDLGVPFQIVAAGSAREYRDEARDCAYRARVAAVFVALVIDPGAMLATRANPPPREPPAFAPPRPPPEPATLVSTVAEEPEPTSPQRSRVRLGLGAGVEAGVGSGARIGQAGLGLRIAIGEGRWALAAGATALAPVDTSIGGVAIRQWRVPADVSLRVQWAHETSERRMLEPYAELGVAVALLRETGLELASKDTDTSAELGVRVAAGVHLTGISRISPFLALHGEVVPIPPAISALPRGVVGHTPLIWFGATAGAAWRLF